MTGHVVPGISLDQVKDKLSHVRGALVECPMVRPQPTFIIHCVDESVVGFLDRSGGLRDWARVV